MRRLFYDIEVSPDLVLSWRTGYKIDLNYQGIVKERAIITIAWKWEGEKKVHALTWDKNQNDRSMLEEFMPILDEADEAVAHYGDRFDLPWVKTRCLFHGLSSLPLYKTVDTKQLASKHFLFNSNRLDYIGNFLGMGGKIDTNFQLWKDIVLDNDPKALQSMVKYNKRDVALLEGVFLALQKSVPNQTHAGVLNGQEKWTCPYDASENVSLSKTRVTATGGKKYQMHCHNEGCGGYYSISESEYKKYSNKSRRI